MTVTAAKWQDQAAGILHADINGVRHWSISDGGPMWETIQDAIADGLVIAPEDPPKPPPTNDEIYDQVIKNQKVLKAVVLSLNDGTFVPGANVSNATLKAIVKANM